MPCCVSSASGAPGSASGAFGSASTCGSGIPLVRSPVQPPETMVAMTMARSRRIVPSRISRGAGGKGALPHVGDGATVVLLAEDSGARDDHVRARLGHDVGVVDLDAAVDLDVESQTALVGLG